jgi:hypothetical protein
MAQPRTTAEDLPPAGFISLADAEALISAKVNDATNAMLTLLSERSGAGVAPSGDWARQLAMAIGEVSDQGNRNRVEPAELQRREDARVQLFEKLNEMHERGVDLEYQLKRKVVLDEQLIEPMWVHPVSKKQMHTTLCWPGVPNEAMEPMNDAAREVFALFVTSVGGIQKKNERQRVTPRGVVIVEGQAPTQREAPQVGTGGGTLGVKITGRGQPGEVIQTNILGTIAAPARQINGRAAA